MLFNSTEFLLFFPAVFIAYWSIGHKWRWLLLLVASYFFYMCWKPEYIVLILFSTVVDYAASLGIARSAKPSLKKLWLVLSLGINLGFLFTFKYYNFFLASINDTLGFAGFDTIEASHSLLLPVGISFYTFQTMSYTIDVYRGQKSPERNFGLFALYVSFFPQLVAGPIERSVSLMPQFSKVKAFVYSDAVLGARQALWGFFKKMVVADRLAPMVDLVYNDPGQHQGAQGLVATVFFALQIYCDFSGYSDIAIGTARMLGFKLMENFSTPYLSLSIKEFWSRWHISLSTWFRDYVYIPLGGNRKSEPRWLANLFITFTVSGLWHGASWNFVIWGALHGTYLIIENLGRKYFPKVGVAMTATLPARILTTCFVFALACLGWVFFRATSFSDAVTVISGFTHFSKSQLGLYMFGANMTPDFILALAALSLLGVVDVFIKDHGFAQSVELLPKLARWSLYLLISLAILGFGAFGNTEFIYFQF